MSIYVLLYNFKYLKISESQHSEPRDPYEVECNSASTFLITDEVTHLAGFLSFWIFLFSSV